MTDNEAVKPKEMINKIGARTVVDLLRRNIDERLPVEFVLSENRQKDALVGLLKLLTLFQKKIEKSPYANASVKSLLANYITEKKLTLYISRPDLGAISLIDRIFDELLSSEKFDTEAWQLLAQVRLPITKFALQDYSFFFAAQNMGRRLLNALTLNLLGAGEKNNDEFRATIAKFVEQINSQYKEDVSAFNKVCIEAQSWFAEQQQRLVKIQTRLQEVESDNKDKTHAEPRVIELINAVVAGKQLPTMMIDFIYGEWRNSLRLVSMRDGETGNEWKRQVRATESMVDLVAACETLEGREQYQRFLPSMLKNITSLLVSVEPNSDAFVEAFDPIELVLNALVRGALPDIKEAPMLEAPQQLGKKFKSDHVDDSSLDKINKLVVGDWIRIKTPKGDFEACKLTLKLEGDEPWVLVNHSGKKVAKKTRTQLAKGLQDGVVEIVGQGRWVDDILKVSFKSLSAKPAPPPLVAQPKATKAANAKPVTSKPVTAQEALKAVAPASARTPTDQSASKSGSSQRELDTAATIDPASIASGKPQPNDAKPAPTEEIPLTLVSLESQAASSHEDLRDTRSLTDTILSTSTLSLVPEEPSAPIAKQPVSRKIAPKEEDVPNTTKTAEAAPEPTKPAPLKPPAPLPEIQRTAKPETERSPTETQSTEIPIEKEPLPIAPEKPIVRERERETVPPEVEKPEVPAEPIVEAEFEASEDVEEESWEAYVAEPRVFSEDELAAAQVAIDQLNVGGWVLWIKESGEEVRCKLAVKMKATSKLIFVNRLGLKELDITQSELAEKIAAGEVTIQDTGAQFDSALERVVKNIQAEKKLG